MYSVGANDDVKLAFRAVAKSDARAALVLVDRRNFNSQPNPHVCCTQQQLMKSRAVDAKVKACRSPDRPYVFFVLPPASCI
jgi:hypothetical protein